MLAKKSKIVKRRALTAVTALVSGIALEQAPEIYETYIQEPVISATEDANNSFGYATNANAANPELIMVAANDIAIDEVPEVVQNAQTVQDDSNDIQNHLQIAQEESNEPVAIQHAAENNGSTDDLADSVVNETEVVSEDDLVNSTPYISSFSELESYPNQYPFPYSEMNIDEMPYSEMIAIPYADPIQTGSLGQSDLPVNAYAPINDLTPFSVLLNTNQNTSILNLQENFSSVSERLGTCRPTREQAEFFDVLFKNDLSATITVSVLNRLKRVAFPKAFTQDNIVAGQRETIREMQKMLMRSNCYTSIGDHADGLIGPQTQTAIRSFVNAYQDKYPGLSDSLVHGEAIDATTGDQMGRQLLGVTPRFMEVLSDIAVQNLAFKERIIRQANLDGDEFNIHSYNIAIFKEWRGDYLTETNPNYTPLQFTEEDIDICARTLWGEVRGEELEGRIASAYSMINRTMARLMDDGSMPRDLHYYFKPTLHETCQATNYSSRSKRYYAQYSVWNTDDPNYPKMQALDIDGSGSDNQIFREMVDVLNKIRIGEYADPINGAQYYHTHGVRPAWSRGRTPDHIIEGHRFFNLYDDVTNMQEILAELDPLLTSVERAATTAETLQAAADNTQSFANRTLRVFAP